MGRDSLLLVSCSVRDETGTPVFAPGYLVLWDPHFSPRAWLPLWSNPSGAKPPAVTPGSQLLQRCAQRNVNTQGLLCDLRRSSPLSGLQHNHL